MITLHRQRYWFRLITVIVIISFIPQNITWAVPALETETLAPTSEFVKLASPIDLEMAGIGHTFIQWIEKTNIRDINKLTALLKRNPQVQKDLFKMDIWTLFYPDRIELIGPKFTLTFLDASRYPQTGLCHIAKTNMRIDLYRHPRALLPPRQATTLQGSMEKKDTPPVSDTTKKNPEPTRKPSRRHTVSGDTEQMSREAAEYFVNEVNQLIAEKGKAVVCFATGDTPREMYRIIREEYGDAVDWSKVIAFHLDEYVFSPEEYPLGRCRYSYCYSLQEEIFNYLPIPEENIHFLNDIDPFTEVYCGEYLEKIKEAGGIDLCILGIGKNGHIAFDEPGSSFDSTVRKVKLKFSTRWANRRTFGRWWQFWRIFKVPKYAFTLGIREIMASKKIMLLARGKDKAKAVQKSLFGPVTEEVPASILQRHPDVRYFLDKKAFSLNEDADEVEELGYRIFGHMPKVNLVGRVFSLNWWRDKAMYWGMRLGPIKKWLMKMIDKYPTLPIYKKIPLFWFGIGMRFIAPRFIAGGTVEKAAENILRLRDKRIDYTVDILGEAVTSEEEAEENKDKYIRLLEELTDFTGTVNLSLKLTSLVSTLDQGHKEIAKRRLREILRRAIGLGAFITIDMEQYCYKDLTLEIYKEILEEEEFKKCDNLQIVIQVYLRDSPRDIEEFIKWAKSRYERTGARASVRLVKGAYWDKEVEWAKEDRRPSPVWSEKWQTDRNYEDMSALLLQNHQYIQTVFGTHNVRSMARVIYEAHKNKIPKDKIEFQMLYGMGEPFQDALVKMGYRVRAYVPYGPLLKGLKYFTRRIEENTSQESFLLQSLSDKYRPSELLKEPGPSVSDYKKRFSQALDRLLRLSPKEFIPDAIKDRLKEFNGGKSPRCYSFDSLDRLRGFTRWGYLWRLIKPDEVIVVRLILPEKHGRRLLIAALRFRDLKEKIEWGKTYFLIDRYFDTNDCVVKDEGIYLGEELREKKLGSGTFRLFVQRLSESGFGGYPYRVQIENPKLLHLAYEELDGRINTTNTGLTQIFVQKFEKETGERYTGNPREFLGYLVGLYRQGRDIDWKALKTPVEGTIPGLAEPRTPKERFEEMLSSSEMLKRYIEDGRIFELIPEWRDWVKMHDNPNFRNYHHLSPEEHLVLVFSRLESGYFWEMIKKYRLRGAGAAHLRRALFLHDFGKIVALQRDLGYSHDSHIKHPEYSAEIAKEILLRLGYTPSEIEEDILLIRYHEVLKNLAQFGEAEIPPLEFVNLLKNTWNLRLLKVLQLVDAASVRHKFENSLSIGLERRVNEIADIIEDILIATGEQRAEQEKRFLDYLIDIKRQNNEIGYAFGIFREVLDRHGIEIDKDKLKEAFQAMHRSHMGLPRKDGRTPFAIHPIEVATVLVDESGIRDPNWIIAALLHDVLEDTRTTVGAIELLFGEEGKEIASIVRLLSKPDISRYASKHEQDVDFYHRIIYGADGIEDRDILTAAQTIKVADRINNLRTLTPGIAASQINETYEVFIPYFIGETEVPVDIKRALIKELIIQGKKWRILTPEQIGELEVLSRDIIEFKIPELRVEASPYNFIRGLVEYRQEKQPGTPPVLAFNGLSGVGRTTFAAHLQGQLKRVGKKVVVFDANDYLLPRSERDKVLRRARETGVAFYEQREKFYDIDRFRREVWDRIKGFKESSNPTLKFTLSGLYNRLTGRLDASKEYEIDRDTIILIEGIHIFQKDLLPLYDATFFVYAPREVCLANVLEREKGKPEEYQQSPELIRERFELIDWPSYRKHLLEYWRASGFVIDNADYRNPLVKKNPFPRYPEKAPDVPKEFTDPQERLNRNLEDIFSQLKNKGISPYDIIPGAKNHIDIFRKLLAVKEIEQLFPPILLPDRNVDSLDYFLDQLTAQTNIVELFFRLFAVYIQSLKTLPPIICKPSFPQDLLLQILSKRKWEAAKFTPNFILYRSNGLYIEVPRVGSIVIGDQERQFVYRHFALRFIYGLFNRYNHIRWVRGLRELSKWVLHYFKPQRIISGEYMRGYRLMMEKAPHLITPTRIVEDNNLWEKIRLEGIARQNKALLLQLSEGKLLIDYIHELINRGAWDEVEKTLEDAFNFLEGLFQYGLADLDPEVNIWENLVITEDGRIKTCDAESITDNLSEVRSYCNVKIQDARPILELLKWRGIGEVLFSLQDTPNCFLGIIKTLIDRFGEENAERLIKTFLNKLTRRFDIKEYPWEQDGFFADTLERIRKENPKVVVFYHKHYPLEPLGDVVEVIKSRYPPSQILFVEFPHSYRPLGYALNSFQYLYSSAQAMTAGVHILKDYSPEENKKFGNALLRFISEVENRREEISRLHEQGLKTDSGIARESITEILDEIRDALGVDFSSMLNALARNNPSLRDDEELLAKKLAEQYPGLHFISLHGQFTSIPARFELQRPYNDIHGTRRASQYHIPAAEKVREKSHYGKWGYARTSFLSDFLRRQIDPPYFDNNISYAFFELPIYPFPKESLPIPSDELIKAVIGSYLLQDPYFSTAKDERNMDMDYFRVTPLLQESRDSIAEDLREYLDIFLQQIEEPPAVIEGELSRGVEIPIEDAIEMLRKLCEGSITIPMPYVKGFEQFGDRLLESGELDALIELLVGYLISEPTEYKITALKRKDRGLIIEKILQDVPLDISSQGSPAECLKTLFDGRHFADNPITLKNLRLKRINPKTSRPYNVKTIRVELRNLITLGLVQFQRRRGRFEYYLTDRLRRAPPEAILEICNIALTSPPHKTPLLRYDGVSKLNKDEIDEMREKITEIIHSPKNRLIKIVRDSTAANNPDILAEYSIRAYGITSNYPAAIGQLNPRDRNQLDGIKDYRLYIHDFQRAPKAVARLSMFRSLHELSVYGDQYVFTGNTLDSQGRLFLGNRLKQLIKLTNYPHHACAIQLKNGMLYRIWIFDRHEPDKIIDFRQLSTIEEINGTFRETFYRSMKKTDFDNLGDCIIKGHRLDVSGRLQIGTRDAGLGIEFSNCRTEIEVRSGQIKTVRVLDELGRISKKADFILIYQNGELIGSYYEQLTQEKFDTLGDVTLKEIWLNSQGILSLDVLRDPAACFTKYPNHKAEVDIMNKHVDRVRILDAGGSVIQECIFCLVYDSQGNLISSFWTGILEDDFNKLTGTIKRINTDSNGRLKGGTKTLGVFTGYPRTDAEVDVINGIVDKVRLLKDDRVIEEYEYSLIYDASGRLIDSFREIYSPQERMRLERATVKRVKLDDHGVLVFGGEYWGTFKDYPKHEVEFDVENGVVKEVRILAKDGIKTFLPVLIYRIQPDGTERLVDSFFEYYYPEKFAKLDNHVIRRFKLDSNGNLDIGGRIGPNKNRRRAIFYPYRDQEVIIYVKNGHIEKVTDTAGNYIGKEGDYIEAEEMPKSYTGRGGSDKECNPIIKQAFSGKGALNITKGEITVQAKAILLGDERFKEKEGFRKVRVVAIPGLPLDGHYGMGGKINRHTLPTVYIPKRLYDYLLERHSNGDPDARIELADYLYHKYMEMRLVQLGGMSAEEAHRIVDHSDYYKEEKEYISPETYDKLSSARKRLLFYFEIRERLSDVALEFVRWILKSYPPHTGWRHLAICQIDANPLGVMLKSAIEKLGWTHLVVTDIYLNKNIVGDWHGGYVVQGNNSPEEIFEYLHQEGILDNDPITFIDAGIFGSIPMMSEQIIRNSELWMKAGKTPVSIDIETRLLYFTPEIGFWWRMKGLNEILPDRATEILDFENWLEGEFPRRYSSPKQLVRREGRIVPDLQKSPPEQEILAGIAEYAARDLVFEKIASGELFSARERIKMAIRGLLAERQREEHKKDAEFRRGFEREIESQVSRLHGLVSDEEGRLLSRLTDACAAGSLEELDLYALYNHLRNISGLDLLDDTGQSYIGPTAEHVKLMPVALESLARGRGNLNFFKDRFVEVSDETEDYLGQMKGMLGELYTDKDVFSAFVVAFLLHDYGLLLMQSGANSHAVSGPRLLNSFLDKLPLSNRQKAVIKILVEEHAKLYLMFAGHVTPFNYEYSLHRFEEYGIPKEMVLRMYALFLFLDTAACDSEWARRENWLTDEYVRKILHFTDSKNLDGFKENYLERRLQLLTGDDSHISGDSALVAEDDYVNRLWFNLTPLAGAVLRDLGKPNILKLLHLLAKIYRHHGLDPQKIGIYFIADNDSGRRLREVLEGEIGVTPFPFKIKITEHEVVINLKHNSERGDSIEEAEDGSTPFHAPSADTSTPRILYLISAQWNNDGYYEQLNFGQFLLGSISLGEKYQVRVCPIDPLRNEDFADILEEIKEFNPTHIALTPNFLSIRYMRSLIREIRERDLNDAFICAGGPLAGKNLGLLQKIGFDLVVHGDGEIPFANICRITRNKRRNDIPSDNEIEDLKKVPGLWMRWGEEEIKENHATPARAANLDEHPWDFSFFTLSKRRQIKGPLDIADGRGCNHRCVFCSVEQGGFNAPSDEALLERLHQLKRAVESGAVPDSFKEIFFRGTDFRRKASFYKRFFHELHPVLKLKQIQINLDSLKELIFDQQGEPDTELLRILKELGVEMLVGGDIFNDVERRHTGKISAGNIADMEKVFSILSAYGINLIVYVIETTEVTTPVTLMETYRNLMLLKIKYPNIKFIKPGPALYSFLGDRIQSRLQRQGLTDQLVISQALCNISDSQDLAEDDIHSYVLPVDVVSQSVFLNSSNYLDWPFGNKYFIRAETLLGYIRHELDILNGDLGKTRKEVEGLLRALRDCMGDEANLDNPMEFIEKHPVLKKTMRLLDACMDKNMPEEDKRYVLRKNIERSIRRLIREQERFLELLDDQAKRQTRIDELQEAVRIFYKTAREIYTLIKNNPEVVRGQTLDKSRMTGEGVEELRHYETYFGLGAWGWFDFAVVHTGEYEIKRLEEELKKHPFPDLDIHGLEESEEILKDYLRDQYDFNFGSYAGYAGENPAEKARSTGMMGRARDILLEIERRRKGARKANTKSFRESIDSLIACINEESTKGQSEEGLARRHIRDVFKKYSSDPAQDPLARSMAWHVLAGIGADSEFKGRVVYSLKALLESGLNDGNEMERLKAFVERTRGRVFFYAGDYYRGNHRYDFLKGSIVTKAAVGSDELTIFMLNKGDMEHLGLDKAGLARLAGNRFIVPVEGTRDVEDDILLGFELIRNNGNTEGLPSLFKLLLAEAVKEWLKAKGRSHSKDDIEQVLQMKVPETRSYSGDIEHARQVLISL